MPKFFVKLIRFSADAHFFSQCSSPIEPGPCKGFELRYGYDSAAQKCIRFAYGGCLGNPNNFKTRKECEEACVETQSASN
ncbi:unnamed protein product, partial [Strongylus vulgaris]